MSISPRLRVPLALVVASSVASAQVRYVDDSATGANDGTSWTDAYVDLQTALASASSGTQIWVAEGIYRPAPPGGSTAATFVVAPGRRWYGGFAGTETSITQRDVDVHPTILSGDLSGNDGPGFTNRADNCERVVDMSDHNGDTVLDGFVVQGADSPGPFHPSVGGGLGLSGVAPRIEHCVIRDNRNYSSGGGVHSEAFAARFVDCVIEGNDAGYDGGGMHWLGGGGRMERCVVRGNRAVSTAGGGVYQLGTAEYHDCVFAGNWATFGGGIYGDKTDGRIVGCTIYGNIGGGLSLVSVDVANSIAWGNFGPQIQSVGGIILFTTQQGAGGPGGLDPRFADPDGADGVIGTSDDDFRLLPGSPCIDFGSNNLVQAGALIDVEGLRRFSNDPDTIDAGVGTAPIVDRGAHEYRPCAAPVSFCVTSPNSVGPGARIGSSGTAKLYANDLVLKTSGCPPNTFGLYFHGSTTQQAPFGNGFRCVGGNVLRVGIVAADAIGIAQLAFDASASPIPLAAGTRRHFQFWYRNLAGGGAGFNLSDGLTVQFCP